MARPKEPNPNMAERVIIYEITYLDREKKEQKTYVTTEKVAQILSGRLGGAFTPRTAVSEGNNTFRPLEPLFVSCNKHPLIATIEKALEGAKKLSKEERDALKTFPTLL